MRKIFCLFILFACMHQAFAQDGYAVSLIDTSLLRGANAVVRYEDENYEFKDGNKAIYKYKKAITILNERGDKHSSLFVHYDPFNVIDYIEGTLFDGNGKKVRSIKKSEISDHSGSGSNLATDSRYKAHNFYHKAYPYTVEYEYSTIRKETMFFPPWYPLAAEACAVQQSTFSIIVPSSYQFRYKAFNYAGDPVISQQSNKTLYQWTVKKLPAVQVGFGFPGWRYITPMVITGPTDFQIEDYKGRMSNWEEFGKFILTLNQGRDALPDHIKQQVHALTANQGDARSKVEALYNFLQKNTRYISIQLGLGGWRPFEASNVAKNSYGDCKALSNYMYSLLKEAGIQSHYAVIRAGQDAEHIVYDFPSSQFNHAVLCVPLQNDTMWLECTSQDEVPGYMGGFTGNRKALLITAEGGKLVPTPAYGLRENVQSTTIKATMDENGNLSVNQQAQYSALQQERYHYLINNLSKEKVKEFLNEHIDLSTFEVLDFNYTQEKKRVPVVHETLRLAVNNYAQTSGKRLFVTPNIGNRFSTKLTEQQRKYPVLLRTAYQEVDSTEITLPAGYKPEALPKDTRIESKFGKYETSCKVENNKITYYRKMEHYNGLFDASTYADLVKFYDQLYKADRSKVVLVKE